MRDAGDRASTLPHLSHALQETWTRREGATLTVAGYRDSGGIAGAIAQSAEDVFRRLDPADQELCRSLMLRLLERGADGTVDASSRRQPSRSSRTRAGVECVERLAQARLVTLDGDAVVVAHEAVATAWPRLDAWLEEDAEGSAHAARRRVRGEPHGRPVAATTTICCAARVCTAPSSGGTPHIPT